MKKPAMKLNRFNLVLLASIFMAGCNGGHPGAQSENTTQQEVSETTSNDDESSSYGTPLKAITLDNPKLNGAPQYPVAWDGLKIGDGYNPQTGRWFTSSTPILQLFTYNSGTESNPYYQVPLTACPSGFAEVDIGNDFGNIAYNDLDVVSNQNAGFGINYGLYKLQVAAAFNQQNTLSQGSMVHNKYFGAKVSCWIRSFVDKSSAASVTQPEKFATALINANPEIKKQIEFIRNAHTDDEKRKAVEDFYTSFGTHMISAVETSEFAMLQLKMIETTTSSKHNTGYSGSASFAYPGFTLDGGLSHAHAEAVDMKYWAVSTEAKSQPEGTNMNASISKMVGYINDMKGSGIINFGSLTHSPTQAAGPTLPKLPDISGSAKPQNLEATELYKEVQAQVAAVKKLLPSEDAAMSITNSAEAISLKNALETANKARERLEAKISDLNIEQNKAYSAKEALYLNAFADRQISSIATTYINNDTAENLKKLTDAINLAEKKGGTGASSKLTEQKKLIADFLNNYPTFNAYLTKGVYTGTVDLKDAALEDKIKNSKVGKDSANAWITSLDHNIVLQGEIKDSYEQRLDGKISLGNLGKLNNPAPKLLATNTLTGPQDEAVLALYGARPITDFNIVPWSDVFPELLGTYALDDTTQVTSYNIKKEIDSYMRKFRYLQIVASLVNDIKINKMVNAETIQNGPHEQLQSVLNNLVGFDDGNLKTITLNKTNYNLTESTAKQNFYTALKTLTGSTGTTSSFAEDGTYGKWNKIVNSLMDRNLIGQFAAIPAIQPKKYSQYDTDNSYYLFDGRNESAIPSYTSNEIVGFKDRAKRVILQILWNELYNGKGTNKAKDQNGNWTPIPAGVLSYNTPNYTIYGDRIQTMDYSNAIIESADIDKLTGNALVKIAEKGNATATDPYYALGYLPIVTMNTTTSTTDGVQINGLALLSSTGRIVGSGADSTGGKLGSANLTYNLDITNGDVNHIYQLAINNNGTSESFTVSYPVTEFHWDLERRDDAVGVKEDAIYIGLNRSLDHNVFSSCKMTFKSYKTNQWKDSDINNCDGKEYPNTTELINKGVWYGDDQGDTTAVMGRRDMEGATIRDSHVYGIRFNNPHNGPYLSEHVWSRMNKEGDQGAGGWWQLTPYGVTYDGDLHWSPTSNYWRNGETMADRSARYGSFVHKDGKRATTVFKLALIPVTNETVKSMNLAKPNMVLPTFIH